jgi:endogenous inhibitor of DNA gyrase (YacG/DUF329 family)
MLCARPELTEDQPVTLVKLTCTICDSPVGESQNITPRHFITDLFEAGRVDYAGRPFCSTPCQDEFLRRRGLTEIY